MSYSFTVKAANKTAALAAAAAKLDEVVAQQPVHKVDRPQALAAAELFVGLLPDDDTRDVSVGMSGYVSGAWDGQNLLKLGSANVSVGVTLIDRLA